MAIPGILKKKRVWIGIPLILILIFGFMFGRPLIDLLRRKQKKGQPIRSQHPLRMWLRKLQDELGLQRGVHILRHTFATQALHKGASLREVQALLGHTNIATTERYLHTDSDNLDQAMLRVARGRGATSAAEPKRGPNRATRTRRNPGETKSPPRKTASKRSKRP